MKALYGGNMGSGTCTASCPAVGNKPAFELTCNGTVCGAEDGVGCVGTDESGSPVDKKCADN